MSHVDSLLRLGLCWDQGVGDSSSLQLMSLLGPASACDRMALSVGLIVEEAFFLKSFSYFSPYL